MKVYKKLCGLLFVALLFSSCRGGSFTTALLDFFSVIPRQEIDINGTRVLYTSSVTESDLENLIEYLVESGFANGEKRTVQLTKTGNTYEVSIPVKKDVELDQEDRDLWEALAAEISEYCFDGAQVDIHLCDPKLKTLVVVPMASVPQQSTAQQNAEAYNGMPLQTPWEGAVYSGVMTADQTLQIQMVLGGITPDGQVIDSYYRYYRNGRYGDPIMLSGYIENGILTLFEREEDDPDAYRAVMRFSGFTTERSVISGLWQDYRNTSNTYTMELSVQRRL